jgi:hypothetical protein
MLATQKQKRSLLHFSIREKADDESVSNSTLRQVMLRQ